MEQVSRPFQLVLVLVLGFAGLWFVALRPKADTGAGAPAPTPAPAQQAPASGGATPAKKSPIPGGLGRAVDKANSTKAQGDNAAAKADTTEAATPQNTTATPIQTPPPTPAVKKATPTPPKAVPVPAGTGVVHSGALAIGRISLGITSAIGARTEFAAAAPAKRAVAAHRAVKAGPEARRGFGTPAKIRAALAKRHAVVLLFYSARSSDDRQIRREVAAVNRRHGRVQVWAVSVRGLSRFQNVLQGAQVLENPTVVVLSRRAPYIFPGYTDHEQINQAAAVALRPGKA